MDIVIVPALLLAAGAALTTYLVLRRDLTARRAGVAAAVTAVVAGLGWVFTLYLAVAAYVVALGVYLLARRFLPSVKASVLTAAAALAAVTLASVAAFAVALQMM
jgi:hypothetical protein